MPRVRLFRPRSLRQRVLVPVACIAIAFVVATAALLHGLVGELVLQRIRSRSELISNMVVNAVEAEQAPADVRRIVMALGAEPQVRQIVVVLGSPPRVVAATRNEWLDRPLSEVADPRLRAQVAGVIRSRRQNGALLDGGVLNSFVAPIQRDEAGESPLRGAVAVTVDGSLLRTQLGAWDARFLGLFVLLELLALVFAELVLRRWVLAPVRAISDEVARARAGDVSAGRHPHADDELGRLGRSLNELHADLQATIAELEFQKLALDRSATVMAMDAEDRIVFANDAYCSLTGYSRDELLGRAPDFTHLAVAPPGDLQDMWTALAAGRVWRGETSNRARDGRTYWVDATVIPTLDDSGRLVRRTAVLFDISERRRAEAEARAADLRFRDLADSAPVFIWRTDAQGRTTFFNRPFLQFLGATLEQACGANWSGMVHEDEREAVERAYREALAARQPFGAEFRVRRHDGELRTLLARGVPGSGEGESPGLVGSCVDITERVRAEQALRDSEARTRQILETTVDAVITIDAVGAITGWTHQAERMFGWPAAEVIGRGLAETIVPVQYRAAHARGLARFMRTGEGHLIGQRVELTALRRSGEEFAVELSISTLPLECGTTFSAFVRDISERKRAETELVRARDAAQTASRAKSEFLATMSHEIRTPMNGVIGFTDLLLDTPLDPTQQEYAETIRSSGQSLLSLINDILDFSKIEAGKLDVERVVFDARRAAGEVVELLTARAEEQGLELVFEWPADLPEHAIGDPMRFRQVLLNLAGNAIKFTPSGHVFVAADRHVTGGIRVRVRDTGIGIPDDKIPALFRKFTQADSSTTRRFGGTGLGLAISKQLVELMDGTIGADSRAGEGSTFWFTLPAPAAAAPAAEPAEPQWPAIGRVLVVDDAEPVRRVLCAHLGHVGIEAVGAAGAEEAMVLLRVALAGGRPFSAAIVDLHLPGTDGEALGRAILADRSTGTPGLVLLVPGSHRGAADHFRAVGFAEVVCKPVVRPELLLASLVNTHRGHATAATPVPPARGARRPSPALVALPETAGARTFPGARVLLAEDGPVNRKLALRVLGKLGCAVDVAQNGIEACALAAATEYSLIFMDCHMPEMDGFEATVAIRAREADERMRGGVARPVPIVAVTASVLKEDRDRCFACGMDDFISKPFRPEQIHDALARWSEHGEAAGGSLREAA